MSNQVSTITEQNYNEIIQELEQAYFDIPFENSQFQTENFVIGGSITPERAYRNIGLRMNNRLRALDEAKYNLAKENIDIEELQYKIADPNTSDFDRRRHQLDIDYKMKNRQFTAKLVNDALTELNVLYTHFQALPKYTRAEFEQGEQSHFHTRLIRQQQGIQGAAESLTNMNDYQEIVKYANEYQLALANSQQQQLQ